MLFIHQKDRNLVICDKMDGSWGHCAKWNKPEKDKYCVISYVKSKNNELIETEWNGGCQWLRAGEKWGNVGCLLAMRRIIIALLV